MKRVFDVIIASVGLLLFSPILLLLMFLVWLQDFHSPVYIADRVGIGGRTIRMVKMRSMIINADKSGVASTSAVDSRITRIGQVIRRFKVDEVTQLWNVLWGDMSLVGPRPQVPQDVGLYTEVERKLLSVRPGITDFASIVFADEGEILASQSDADTAYQQLIRPWKSRLGLFYVENQSLRLDIQLVVLTLANAISRRWTLSRLSGTLEKRGASKELIAIAMRSQPLRPHAPPGANEVFTRKSAA